METGWGSPSDQSVLDWGWGSPTPAVQWILAQADAGWGSPVQLVVLSLPGVVLVPDDGGEVLDLVAAWPIDGPYLVELIAGTTKLPCLGMRPGEGATAVQCRTNVAKTRLRVCTPRAGVGTWDLRVSWLEGAQQEVVLPSTVRVLPRTRHDFVYHLRRTFPIPVYDAAGART